ncbi:allantoate permease [Ophiostoma piceae UAMH 11346]|uniref:Allantoate permease n=1 Tax=Ophiostoma piceae (strain UAMH 11346) TaxID=1262450 RepID=S3C0D5_OPHP1|nr:allantoate permease [Ophiostoma piceae UAMH 11346]
MSEAQKPAVDVENVENVSNAPQVNEVHGIQPVVATHIPESLLSPDKEKNGHRLDAAAELLRKVGAGDGTDGAFVVTPEDNARILRKIDLVILPIILVVYFLQCLDKATLSYASVFGLIKDTHLVGKQYSWLGSIVYLAQLAAQPLVAWLLVTVPVGKFISTAVLLWGATLACMTAAHSFGGLVAARFFLGLFESSVAPCFIAVTQMWWRRREQTTRVSYWYAMNGLTNMFGSLITYGLGHIDSKLRSYQIIFLFFGLITVAFSGVMYVFMPDSPVEAKFLKTDHDKVIAVERLRMNQMGVMSREWRWDHVREAMYDPKTWCWFALVFSISIPSGGISTFGPLIVESFGFSSFQTILFNVPFGFVQLVATVGGAFVATHIRMKGPVMAALCLPPIAGCVVLMLVPHNQNHRAALLVGYYLISVYPGITPLIYSWSAQNTAGDTKRKVVTGILTIGQCAGNVIGPQLYTTAEAPMYHRGLRSNLALYCVIFVMTLMVMGLLFRLNRSHEARRVAAGKSANIVDFSLYSAADADRMMAEMTANGIEGGGAATGERAFDNLTDLENDEFMFVY